VRLELVPGNGFYSCSVATTFPWSGGVDGWLALPIFFMIGAIAFSASGSFARERQNGAMELLLVSPLDVDQIIWGRFRGIIGQFVPAAGVWLLMFFFLIDAQSVANNAWWVFAFASSALTCAFVGLYFSIRRLRFIAAWGLTLAVGIVAPLLLSVFALFLYAVFVTTNFESASIQPQNLFSIIYIATQVALSRISIHSLRWDLTQRNFRFI